MGTDASQPFGLGKIGASFVVGLIEAYTSIYLGGDEPFLDLAPGASVTFLIQRVTSLIVVDRASVFVTELMYCAPWR